MTTERPVRRVSASQLKMFLSCPRRWALMYLARVPKTMGDALAGGIELHEAIADLLGPMGDDEWHAKWPCVFEPNDPPEVQRRARMARLAVEMAPHAPDGDRVVEPEYFLREQLYDDEVTEFYIKPDLHFGRTQATFVDWKSTSAESPRSPWVLQAPDLWEGEPPRELLVRGRNGMSELCKVTMLRDDLQANLYAYGLMQRWGARKCTARWIYGSKRFAAGRRPKVWTVEHVFTYDATSRYFHAVIRPAAHAMNQLRGAWERGAMDSPLLVPHDGAACSNTGRFCDALGWCGFEPSPVPKSALKLPVLP